MSTSAPVSHYILTQLILVSIWNQELELFQKKTKQTKKTLARIPVKKISNNLCPQPQRLQLQCAICQQRIRLEPQQHLSAPPLLSPSRHPLLSTHPRPLHLPPPPFSSGPIGGVGAADGYLNAKRCCNSARRGGVNEQREIEGREEERQQGRGEGWGGWGWRRGMAEWR